MTGDDTAQLIYLGLMLAAVGGWAMVEFRSRLGHAARMALAWGMIVVALMAGYGLWEGLKRDHARQGQSLVEGRIEVKRQGDGHFYLTLSVNGRPVDFVVDTGATNIVLSLADAEALGFAAGDLRFDGVAMTANGEVRTAEVRLDEVDLEGIRHRDLRAFVNEGAMDMSLLGMDYLRRFRVEMAGDLMILSQVE